MGQLVEVNPEYVYVTIPAEYICVYHRILVMLSDYGEDMLKDCKATCSDRNSGVIECFNMFNAAVAAKKTGKDKLFLAGMIVLCLVSIVVLNDILKAYYLSLSMKH